jgi:hypothetical protein
MASKTHKIEAERLRLALMCGCEKTDTVITWADKIIQEQVEPDYLFLKISLTRPEKYKELISLLRKLGQETDHENALRKLLGRASYLSSLRQIDLREFAKWLYFTEASGWDLPSDLNFIWSTDDQYSLAEDGVYGSVEGVERDFMSELKQFESEHSASPDWYSAALHTIR